MDYHFEAGVGYRNPELTEALQVYCSANLVRARAFRLAIMNDSVRIYSDDPEAIKLSHSIPHPSHYLRYDILTIPITSFLHGCSQI